MAIGTVKFFNHAKGFGFIIPQDGGKDIFVNKAEVELAGIAKLSQGQQLSFEAESDARGAVKAIKLKPFSTDNVPIAVNENSPPPDAEVSSNRREFNRNPRDRESRSTAKIHGTNLNVSRKNADWQRSYDRYCSLAQDANDNVTRESYWQHAEHFLRMMNGSSD